jgi:hypothetical protein
LFVRNGLERFINISPISNWILILSCVNAVYFYERKLSVSYSLKLLLKNCPPVSSGGISFFTITHYVHQAVPTFQTAMALLASST